jgi:tetratricopeptide (TPR) repeat protein
MISELYVFAEGVQAGPLPIDLVRSRVASGDYGPEHLAWWEGAEDWVPLNAVPGLGDQPFGPPPGPAGSTSESGASTGSTVVSHSEEVPARARDRKRNAALIGLLFACVSLGLLAGVAYLTAHVATLEPAAGRIFFGVAGAVGLLALWGMRDGYQRAPGRSDSSGWRIVTLAVCIASLAVMLSAVGVVSPSAARAWARPTSSPTEAMALSPAVPSTAPEAQPVSKKASTANGDRTVAALHQYRAIVRTDHPDGAAASPELHTRFLIKSLGAMDLKQVDHEFSDYIRESLSMFERDAFLSKKLQVEFDEVNMAFASAAQQQGKPVFSADSATNPHLSPFMQQAAREALAQRAQFQMVMESQRNAALNAVRGRHQNEADEFQHELKVLDSRFAVLYEKLKARYPEVAAAEAAEPHTNRAAELYKGGVLDGAIAELDQAIELYPRDSQTLGMRGAFKFDQGNLRGALADFEASIECGNKTALIYFYRGCAKQRTGDLKGAVADFSKAIDLDAEMPDAHAHRAVTYLMQQSWSKAALDLERCIAQAPTPQGWERLWLWVARCRMGQKAEATSELEDWMSRHTTSSSSGMADATIEFILGRRSESDLQQAVASLNPPERGLRLGKFWYYAGEKCLAAGDKVAAADRFTRCLQTETKELAEYSLAFEALKQLNTHIPWRAKD